MRKNFGSRLFPLPVLLLILLSPACFKDKVQYSYTIHTPIFQTLSQVRANIKSMDPVPMKNLGKIYVQGNYVFLNEQEMGIHILDNHDPSHPKNVAFIPIPGNNDLAVRGTTLYADSYGDLLAIDIQDPLHIQIQKILSNVFENRMYYYAANANPDSILIITGWSSKDTSVDYDTYNRLNYYYTSCNTCMMGVNAIPSAAMATQRGIGGSMARFTIVNDYLYTVGNLDLNVVHIQNPSDPVYIGQVQVDWHVETIYPFKDKLFIGSNNGMFMYDIQASPDHPSPAGQFTHVRACDPVIADDSYAYVTLSDGTPCLGTANELQIVDIHELNQASLVKQYGMTHPLGLSKDGHLLFICDERDGLKIYDATDVRNLKLLNHIKDATVYDVITRDGLALVLARNGLYEYEYNASGNIHLIGKLLYDQSGN